MAKSINSNYKTFQDLQVYQLSFELQSNKQFIKFVYISKALAGECRNILEIAFRISNNEKSNILKLIDETVEISKQLANFIKYLKNSKIR